ncbi:MAG: Mg-dependent DNase [Rikenellaceae bacterium]|nr:Mg-dependent DNase [Rikenellaceae bacterium]
MIPLIDVHTHQPRGCAIELVAIQTPNPHFGFCSLGIHPWRVSELSDEQIAEELKMVAEAEIAAIGETGADSICDGDLERQLEVFDAHLEIAERRDLPVIIHSVKCFEPIMQRLAVHHLRAVIFHSWIGSDEQAKRATQRGYRLSFGPRSLASSRSVNTLKSIDDRYILTESDDSGEDISHIYQTIAQLRNQSEEHLREVVFNNFNTIWQSGWNVPSCCSAPKN